MSISAISSYSTAALTNFQPVQSVRPVGRDSDGDKDSEGSESASARAVELKGPLPVDGSVGRSVDISA
jgi:hypothetical protein